MSATHWFMIVVMLGVHYPVAWLYTHWTLKGLPETERLDIMRSVRSRLRLLLVIWIVVLSTVGVALLVSSSLERALYVISYSTIVGFHLIWWPFVVPVFRAVEKELKNRGIERTSENVAPVRTAQLRPRRASDYLAPWMTYLPIAVVISGLGVVAWRLATYSPGEARVWILSITFAVSGLLFWILWSLWVRREIAVSYPAGDAEDSASRQIAAAESVRRFRVLGIYWLQIVASSFFFVAAVLCIEADRGAISERAMGMYGGLGGTAIGIAGGVFGTLAQIRTHRALRRDRA